MYRQWICFPFKVFANERRGPMNKIIEVENLSKAFGHVQAVNNVSFYVEKGSLFSFLGTNGAGKSTTISMILTLLARDQGKITVNGHTVGKNNQAIKQELGVVFQDSVLDGLLTVKENLAIRAAFYGMKNKEREEAINQVANITGLTSFLHRPYGKLSGGERRRADIARALIHQPSILILDEPTTGLDVESRKNIWKTIKQLQVETNMTVFLTTHYIEEAAESDYVVIMHEGEIVAQGTPEELKNQYSSHLLIIQTSNRDQVKQVLNEKDMLFFEEKTLIYVSLPSTKDALPILNECERYIDSFEVKKSSMDEVFLTITRKGGEA